jgi:coiled-coil domain-containing protein 77
LERERTEWLEQIEQNRLKLDSVHDLEEGLTDKKQQLAEVQKAMSDSNITLFDERTQLLKLERENHILKCRSHQLTFLV